MASPFAKVGFTGEVTLGTYQIFRNAQTDKVTFVSDRNYLTGDHEREKDGYAIFLLDQANEPKATPNIARYGVMNTSTIERVILDKVNKTSRGTINGAEFDVLVWDRSILQKDAESGTASAFYVGMLPLGTYYLHETTVPSGYTASSGTNADGTWWWTLELKKDGTITLTGPAATEPQPAAPAPQPGTP